MDVVDEIFYIANMIENIRLQWMKGDMSDAFFSEHLREKVGELRSLREEVIVKKFTFRAIRKAIKKIARRGGGGVILLPGIYK